MTISSLPLSYCTNVHPGQSVAEVEDGLDRYTIPIRAGYGGDLAAGLWLADPVIRELESQAAGVDRFADGLARRGLTCYTLNAFPYGNFHSARVKEQVYLPDWTAATRQDYTLACARVLARLLPEGVEGSISTVPLGFKPFEHPVDFADRCADRLISLARELDRLHDATGRRVRLAIEPEPFCVLETTAEAISFFQRLRVRAADQGALDVVQEYLGVCYDVCHQAVEFEDVVASIRSLDAARIRINKVHITCAIEVSRPGDRADVREALARYVEPRYLHQTFARTAAGSIVKQVDLNADLVNSPADEFRAAPVWRVHFHVPVDAESLGPLGTTRAELRKALAEIPALSYAPHLEVETYTWEVLPGGAPPGNAGRLVDGFVRELQATRSLLNS